jgi:hypothetical protein
MGCFAKLFSRRMSSTYFKLNPRLTSKNGTRLFKKPLAFLLWDGVVVDDVFDALNQIRKDQIKQAGFVFRILKE